MRAHFKRLAGYNRWANERLYDCAAGLDPAALALDRGAFFGSILNTLNHILVGDRIWMHRFSGGGPLPARLDDVPYPDFGALRQARAAEDDRIIAYIDGLSETALAATLSYRNVAGEPQESPLQPLLAHFFNHQTHHRGQVHAMLSQAGQKPPQIVFLYFL